MRDELKCFTYASSLGVMAYSGDNGPHSIDIPQKVVRKGLALGTIHEIKVRIRQTPPHFLDCCAIPNITFDRKTSFIRPNAGKYLAKLKEQVKKHPDAKLMIFGHTDKMDDETLSKQLSERRARSAYALLTKSPGYWMALYIYSQNNPMNENWGVKSVQTILNYLNPDAQLDLSNTLDDRTIKEIETIVTPAWKKNIYGNTIIPKKALRKIFQTYFDKLMEGVDLTESDFVPLKHAGCSDFNPILDSDVSKEENRRVSFFLFDKERLPKFPCSNKDTAPCDYQCSQYNQNRSTYRHKKTFACAYYDSIAKDCAAEVAFPDIIVFDAHMHFMSGHCTPMPLLWGQFPARVVPRSDFDILRKVAFKVVNPRSRLDKVGKNLKWVGAKGMSRLAGTSEMKTEEIAEIGYKQNNTALNRFYKKELSGKIGVRMLPPMIAMPMDMSFAHIDGYGGKAIYTKVRATEKIKYTILLVFCLAVPPTSSGT